jgi:addiction module HigA family antidote
METNTDKQFRANDATPAYPVHPGGILGEELKARGISQKQFAETVGLQATHLSALIHGTRNFTPSVAAKIESGLEGIPAALWMKLQESYNLDVQRKRINPSRLVTGYNPAQFNSQTAHLSEPQSPYGKKRQVTLTIPESDMDLLVSLATRLGWQCQI